MLIRDSDDNSFKFRDLLGVFLNLGTNGGLHFFSLVADEGIFAFQEMGLLEVKHGLLQIAESLDFLHNHAHLIHRAISPEVIIFCITVAHGLNLGRRFLVLVIVGSCGRWGHSCGRWHLKKS